MRVVTVPDGVLSAMRFAPDTLLTPGEQDVLRRFCAGFHTLPVMPGKMAVFGSRATGGADEHSDLDMAVFFDGSRSAELETRLSAIAFSAQSPYRSGPYGIFLRPVPLYITDKSLFLDSIRPDLEVVWTRPN